MRFYPRFDGLRSILNRCERYKTRVAHRKLILEQLEYRRLTTSIDLRTLTAIQGFSVNGADELDRAAYSLSNAGDVNGDGFNDVILGASGADGAGNTKFSVGESYIIFGGSSFSGAIDLANLGTTGVRIIGVDEGDGSGISVSAAGDVNGDGLGDVIIGAYLGQAQANRKFGAGESYIVFGSRTLPNTLNLGSLGALGTTIFGADARDYNGSSVSSAGDMNGDGFDDFAILSKGVFTSKVDLLFGKRSFPATIDLSVAGSSGLKIIGDSLIDSIGKAGDVNGDGFDDFVVGNSVAPAGRSHVIFGSQTLGGVLSMAAIGANGFTIQGADGFNQGDRSGSSVSVAGDINGDGFDDLLIGAYRADASMNAKYDAGSAYVVFGKASFPGEISLATLGTAGIEIFGANTRDNAGKSVSAAGDVNADGFDDFLVGALRGERSFGAAYLLFGSRLPAATVDLAALGELGVSVVGAGEGDNLGIVSGAGDINGDGFDDLFIGAPNADGQSDLKPSAGESYLIFGGNGFTNSISPSNLGNANSNTITGTPSAENLNGASNDDTLVGNGGADVLVGGRGNDTLALSDLGFSRVVGGTGNDTLRLDGNGLSLNLPAKRDNRILGIETIDITGSGSNTLILNFLEVLNLSDESNTLVVNRNVGDVVNIGSGWTQTANELIGGTSYLVYTQGQARLKVQVVGTSAIASRRIFYNRSTSSVFGDGSGNPINAIDPTKQALLPGQPASFANVSNYVKGLNGIVLDIANVGGLITASDFQFATSTGASPLTFTPLAAIPTITVIPEGGVSNSTRIKIEFADNAVRNAWLRVTVLANANTGIGSNDVFYFGSAVGEMNVANIAGPPVVLRTNAADTANVRQNQSPNQNSVGIGSVQDFNKDGRVNATDTANVRQNQTPTGSITYFTAPISLQLTNNSSAADSALADTSWLESTFERRRLSRHVTVRSAKGA